MKRTCLPPPTQNQTVSSMSKDMQNNKDREREHLNDDHFA